MNILIPVFRWALAMVIPSSVLILIILAVKKAAGRWMSAAFHYGIWFLLILRLVIPYTPQSPTSAMNLIPALLGLVQQAETSGIDSRQQVQEPSGTVLKSIGGSLSSAQSDPSGEAEKNSSFAYTPLEAALAVVWLAGMLSYDFYVLWINRRFRRSLNGSLPAEDLRIQKLASRCRSQLHIRTDIPIFYSNAVQTPSLSGVLRPKLLIPKQLTGQLEEAELSYVLLHELAHYKRKDLFVLWGTTVLRGFYWLHPLVWYAFYRMRLDGENACDATVLSHLGEGEQDGYGYLLLHLLELRLPSRSVVSGVGMVAKINQKQLKRRIVMITKFQKSVSVKKIILSVLLVAFISITGLTGENQVSAQSVSSNPVAALVQSSVMPATGEEAAEYWADTLAQRDGAARFAILSDDLKKKEFQDYKDFNFVIGGSSPWVVSYTVQKKDETSSGTEYQINYLFSDSTRAKYEGSETITVQQSGQNWFVVRHEDLDLGCPDLSDSIGQYKDWEFGPAPARLPTKTAEGTARWWAEALKAHNGAYRYACLSPELQTNSEADLLQNQDWVIGTSGVSVTGYSVTPIHQTADMVQYRIQYQMKDSSGKISQRTESITVKKEEGLSVWLVTQYSD